MTKQRKPKRRSFEARALTRLRHRVSTKLYARIRDHSIPYMVKTHGMTRLAAIASLEDALVGAKQLADQLGFD